MSRIVSVVLALLLALTGLAAAAEPLLPTEVLGGTSWRSPDGVEFHFTGDAGVFFSYDPTQPLYRRIATDLYMTSPSTDPCGPFLVLDSARRCTFVLDGVTLLMDDLGDDAAPVAFTYVSYPTLLAGTRWLDEQGTIFEFSADGLEFTCGCYGMLFARTLSSLGAYYEMTITAATRERWYEPDAPYALLPDGDILRVYATKDGLPVLWQTFTRITD